MWVHDRRVAWRRARPRSGRGKPPPRGRHGGPRSRIRTRRPRTAPQRRDEGLVLERGRARHVPEAYDGVAGRDVVGPGLETCGLPSRRGSGTVGPAASNALRIQEVEVGPDPRFARGCLVDPDRHSPHQPRELVLRPGYAGNPRQERGPRQEVLPQRREALCFDPRHGRLMSQPRSRPGRLRPPFRPTSVAGAGRGAPARTRSTLTLKCLGVGAGAPCR